MIELHSRIVGHSELDFDRRIVRRGMRKVGGGLQKAARKQVNRKGVVSAPGEAPARKTGGLFRAIKSKLSRSGMLVSVAPRRTKEHGDNGNFYAAFLRYGTSSGVEPRDDYIEAAFEKTRPTIQRQLDEILQDALIVRKIK